MINSLIEGYANTLLSKTNSFSAPIKIQKIATALNINLKEVELESDVSGFILINDETVLLGYNKSHSRERQRFTIAHEIAHHYLGHTQNTPFFIDKQKDAKEKILYRNNESSTGRLLMEREANAFAAALLMPKELIEKLITKKPTRVKSESELIDYLSKKFEVSNQAMTIRLINLDIIEYDV